MISLQVVTYGVKWLRRVIGIREAKARLSQLVHDARNGKEWIISDRGRPVALIAPLPKQSPELEERLHVLVKRGWIEPASQTRTLPPPLPLETGLAQAWLQEDRGQ